MSVIETRDLRKDYRGVAALRGVSLKVEKGEIFGLLGQNGAGKTTLIKILLGIVKHGEGEASLFGQPAGTAEVRKRVGYLPEDHRFPEYHSAFSLMDYYGALYGMSKDARRKRIPELLEQVGLGTRMHSKIRTYSKGMKQRVGIAQAIFHDPELIFLDEPTDGVDPVGRREIRQILEDLKRDGATIFVNSHLLGEIELMCDRVAVMQKGELIREGRVQDITSQRGTYIVSVAESNFPADELTAMGYKVRPVGERWELTLPEGKDIDTVLDFLREKGFRIRDLVEKRQTLEEAFVSMVDAAEPGVDRPSRKKNRDSEDRRPSRPRREDDR
ncbi:ABC transporter ATP-binding protein [Zavarzinella formosa]|uniref:ABC transporter ATP-binding protein n=1 Tax=Zavarzinella formosa TaxID=360055 RepID=UPI0002F7C10E|nr:ABC transporter ATP-binding protein [Zavarzinella formosa]